jgi:hypothetical protein
MTTSNRISSLSLLTGLKPEWLGTHAAVAKAELAANVAWDGNANQHVPAPAGRIVSSKRGSLARQIGGTAYAMTEAECVAAGRTPGPANS